MSDSVSHGMDDQPGVTNRTHGPECDKGHWETMCPWCRAGVLLSEREERVRIVRDRPAS
jgi:hypothetical protein